MLITVPEAARRTGRNPETIRRWIRSGRLRGERVGTQHLVEQDALMQPVEEPPPAAVSEEWRSFPDGSAQPDWALIVRRSRGRH